jgi:hypothetical protein
MRRKICLSIVSGFLLMNLYGCVALLAGAAGGVGTSAWLSNKLVHEVNSPFEKSINAASSALKNLKLEITKETRKDDVTQIMSNYFDGKTIWIDVHKVTDRTSRIEVRVGMSGDEVAARKIMDKILRYL